MRSRLTDAIGRWVRPSTRRRPTPAGSGQTLHFEYTPELDGEPDPGEVVWTWVPYEDDPMQGKDRPVVIVGRRPR